MALDPNLLLSKLFGWVFRSKQQLFDAHMLADLVDASDSEVQNALKALAAEGKLDTHGDYFSLRGAKIESGSIPKAAPAPAPSPAAKTSSRTRPEAVAAAPEADAAVAPQAKGRAKTAATASAGWPDLPAPEYTWVIDIADALIDFLQHYNRSEVSVAELADFAGPDFADTYPDETEIEGRIYQICEFFVKRGILEAGAEPGTYVAHPVLVDREQSVASKLDRMDVRRATKREYTIECAVPYTGLKGLAVLLYGNASFLAPELTFPTPEGPDYIEVHHIHRIAQGGNESLENLALLNPYHHKWCHFATDTELERMQTELAATVQRKLGELIAEHIGGGKKATKKTAADKTSAKKATATASKAKPAAAKKTAATSTKKPAAAKKPAAKATATKSATAAKPAAKKTAAKKTAAKK